MQGEKQTRVLTKPFEPLPEKDDKNFGADYHKHIHRPISMGCIRAKVAKDAYRTVGQFVVDMELLQRNTQTYWPCCERHANCAAELAGGNRQGTRYKPGKVPVCLCEDIGKVVAKIKSVLGV